MPAENQTTAVAPGNMSAPPRSLSNEEGFNPDDYKDDLCVETLSIEEIEALQALWHIMAMFVDIGWGVDTVQIFFPEVFGTTRTSAPCLPPSPAFDNTESETEHFKQEKGRADE